MKSMSFQWSLMKLLRLRFSFLKKFSSNELPKKKKKLDRFTRAYTMRDQSNIVIIKNKWIRAKTINLTL